MPSYAAIAPIAQHRGREPQLACDLDQRPTAARQQGDRLHLELIRKMTPFLAHSTPSRSRRNLAKVSTNAGEAQDLFVWQRIGSRRWPRTQAIPNAHGWRGWHCAGSISNTCGRQDSSENPVDRAE